MNPAINIDMLKQVYFLAKERAEEINSGENQTFSLSNLESFLEELSTPEPKKEQLINYLESLSFEDIKVIQTVMYLGRDEDYEEHETYQQRYQNFRNYLDSRGWNTKSIEINQIVQKAPLDRYLLNGFRILNI